MEREHLRNPDVNRSHEAVGIPLNRPPGTFSPTGGEGRDEGVRFMGREHLQNSDVNRGHEPTPNPSGGGEPMSGTLAEFPSWEGPGVGRFMESLGPPYETCSIVHV